MTNDSRRCVGSVHVYDDRVAFPISYLWGDDQSHLEDSAYDEAVVTDSLDEREHLFNGKRRLVHTDTVEGSPLKRQMNQTTIANTGKLKIGYSLHCKEQI